MINLKGIDHIESTVATAPEKWTKDERPILFLAGSIDNGDAVNWQSQVCAALANCGIQILNPRRTQWDPGAGESEVVKQINWEMDAMDAADMILMYFAPGSKSPVTMLELGAYGPTGKVLCCCPAGFWRKTNVDVFCARTGVESAASLEKAIEIVKTKLCNEEH